MVTACCSRPLVTGIKLLLIKIFLIGNGNFMVSYLNFVMLLSALSDQ